MKVGLPLNVFWQGTSKPLPSAVTSFMLQDTLTTLAFVWLNLSLCFLLQNKLFTPVTCTERLHSWYCAKLEQPKSN